MAAWLLAKEPKKKRQADTKDLSSSKLDHYERRDRRVVEISLKEIEIIKTTYDISLDSQISLLPRGFSPPKGEL